MRAGGGSGGEGKKDNNRGSCSSGGMKSGSSSQAAMTSTLPCEKNGPPEPIVEWECRWCFARNQSQGPDTDDSPHYCIECWMRKDGTAWVCISPNGGRHEDPVVNPLDRQACRSCGASFHPLGRASSRDRQDSMLAQRREQPPRMSINTQDKSEATIRREVEEVSGHDDSCEGTPISISLSQYYRGIAPHWETFMWSCPIAIGGAGTATNWTQ